MSERNKRRVANEALVERRKRVQELREELDKEESALKLAQEVIDESPRQLTETKLILEWTPQYMNCFTAWCGECDKKVLGYQHHWTHTPCCGSFIKAVEQEKSPQDRLNRNAVATAMAEISKVL